MPIDIRLDDLHFVLQIAIGWQNGHPFEFRVGDRIWGLRDRDIETAPLPAEAATLAEFWRMAARSNTTMCWARTGNTPSLCSRAGARRPACATRTSCSAEGRCPPADIGGPVGYETYLRSIADPASVNHADMLDFDAPDFDPNVVDEARLRANLAELGRYIGRKPLIRHPEAQRSGLEGRRPERLSRILRGSLARTSG